MDTTIENIIIYIIEAFCVIGYVICIGLLWKLYFSYGGKSNAEGIIVLIINLFITIATILLIISLIMYEIG